MNPSFADLLIPILTSAAMRLPILIAVAVSMVWVLGSPRGQVRAVALSGLGVMGAAALLGMAASVIPQLLVAQGAYETLRGIGMLMGWLQFALNLMLALSVVLIVWAMTRTLRDQSRN